MKCTANIRVDLENKRCERGIGHAGLHRYYIMKNNRIVSIQEFTDFDSWYPQYDVDEQTIIKLIIKDNNENKEI